MLCGQSVVAWQSTLAGRRGVVVLILLEQLGRCCFPRVFSVLIAVFEPIMEVVAELFQDVHVVRHILWFQLVFRIHVIQLIVLLALLHVNRPPVFLIDLFVLSFLHLA